jgi:hypothetical protein
MVVVVVGVIRVHDTPDDAAEKNERAMKEAAVARPAAAAPAAAADVPAGVAAAAASRRPLVPLLLGPATADVRAGHRLASSAAASATGPDVVIILAAAGIFC